MYQTGALILDSASLLLPALAAASRVVSKVLYIPLNDSSPSDKRLPLASKQIREIYFEVSKTSPLLDVRILLPPPANGVTGATSQGLQYGDIDVVLSSLPTLEDVRCSAAYTLLTRRARVDLENKFKQLKIDLKVSPGTSHEEAPAISSYNDVVLGGTFDNIHNGHRLLLTQSALITNRRIVVGISSEDLLASKILPELIKPVANRIADVKMFLTDVQPWISHEVVGITDVYGPTVRDGELECVVVSPETLRGGEMINTEREKKGLSQLAIHSIQIVDRTPSDSSLAQEDKLSSSDIRRGMLGSYRPKSKTTPKEDGAYLIGLTGGIASGKTSIVSRLSRKGAWTINCDKLGHEAYKRGTTAYNKIIETFGEGVLDDNKEINRKVLGPLVFADKGKLELLNGIVWPEIWRLVEERISRAQAQGHRICVVDAAVMLSAGWHRNMNEIWVTIAPPKDVIARIVERDGLTAEAARNRMASQPANQEYVDQADVVFCTQWEPDYTQKQVDKAWDELQVRLGLHSEQPPSSQL